MCVCLCVMKVNSIHLNVIPIASDYSKDGFLATY